MVPRTNYIRNRCADDKSELRILLLIRFKEKDYRKRSNSTERGLIH